MDVKNVEALLKKLSLSLDQWRLSVVKGKVLIGDIICQLYPEEKTREPNPPDSVQTLTLELANLVADMEEVIISLERVRNKFTALLELNSLPNQTGAQNGLEINKSLVFLDDLHSWINSIYQAYKEQFGMNQVVLNEVCHLSSREVALLHQGVWLLQPALHNQTELYAASIRQLLAEPT